MNEEAQNRVRQAAAELEKAVNELISSIPPAKHGEELLVSVSSHWDSVRTLGDPRPRYLFRMYFGYSYNKTFTI